MNIWLPIVVNAIILGILVAGIFAGKKNGFVFQLARLVFTCGAAVGLYFLNPIVANKLVEIPFIHEAVAHGIISFATVKSLTLAVMFIAAFFIITGILKLVRLIARGKKESSNTAKQVKFKGITKEETRKFRKEQKRLHKTQKKEEKIARRKAVKTRVKVLGAILGFIEAVLIGFVIVFPLKSVFKDVKEIKPELVEIEKGYEYTPYGQLDKVTDIVNKVLGE